MPCPYIPQPLPTMIELLSLHRYRRCSDADHIRRDVDIFTEQAKKLSEEKKIIDQIISFKEQVCVHAYCNHSSD